MIHRESVDSIQAQVRFHRAHLSMGFDGDRCGRSSNAASRWLINQEILERILEQ